MLKERKEWIQHTDTKQEAIIIKIRRAKNEISGTDRYNNCHWMGENSGLNTAEKSICGVEHKSEESIQSAAQKDREIQNMEDSNKTWKMERKGLTYFSLDFQMCQRKSRAETIFEKIMTETLKPDNKKKCTSGRITVKLQDIEIEEKLKDSEEEDRIDVRGVTIRLTVMPEQ